MIPTNLKIGDTFVDGGLTYKVTKICEPPYAYESEIVEKAKKVEVKEEVKEEIKKEVKEEKTYTKTEINRLPNAKLEELCKEYELEVGTGAEMKRAIIKKLDL